MEFFQSLNILSDRGTLEQLRILRSPGLFKFDIGRKSGEISSALGFLFVVASCRLEAMIAIAEESRPGATLGKDSQFKWLP